MASIYSLLPDDLIEKIVRIEAERIDRATEDLEVGCLMYCHFMCEVYDWGSPRVQFERDALSDYSRNPPDWPEYGY